MGLDNPLHIAFLVVILLLVFGARRLPEIGRSLGSGMREFKESISGESSTAVKGGQPALTQATQPPPQAPVAQPAPAQAPAAAQAPAPAQPAQAPVEQSHQA
jgi:sec-independent protein translocase protein TatA